MMLKWAIKAIDDAMVEMHKCDDGERNEAKFAAACIEFVQKHGATVYTALKTAEEIEKNGVYSKKSRVTLEGLAGSATW